MIFNERLKLLRIERSYTQEAAAKAIGIADYYGVSVDWLMGRTDVRSICGKE